MIDSHCHLHDARFDDDRAQAVQRARDAGVRRMLLVGCDLDDTDRAIAAARSFGLAASVGIHPHEAKDAPEDLAAAFDARLDGRATVVAIGETGLDYYYDHSPRDVQARVLRDQLRFARDRDLPLIFHQRDAFDDFVAVLREEFVPGRMRGVVHCFTGNTDQARVFVDEFGLLLGIGGVLTFANAQPLRDAVRAAGLESLVLETDAPYLAPVPMRGRRNEPAFVVHVADKLAELLDLDPATVAAATDRNAHTLLGI